MKDGVRNVAVLIFDDVEVLDFSGPFEVFSVTGGRDDRPAPFRVYTVAEKPGPVMARNGLSVNPQLTLADTPQPDVLVVPGGRGTRREMHNSGLIGWIEAQAQQAELVLSVCTGALLLARAGLLNGLAATTFHDALDELRAAAPGARVVGAERWVDCGRIVTSAGISAGIDASLHVVERLLGRETALETARYMEYDWRTAPASIAGGVEYG